MCSETEESFPANSAILMEISMIFLNLATFMFSPSIGVSKCWAARASLNDTPPSLEALIACATDMFSAASPARSSLFPSSLIT